MSKIAVVQPTVTNMEAAKIEFNKDDVKSFLEDALHLYGNQVVTEDTVKDAKKTCADLNKLNKNLDTFRKEKKKFLIAEVTKFESDIKEIKGIVDAVYQPIKDQVDHFTELKRQEKEEIVNGIIDAVRHETGIRDEYFSQMEFNPSWLNASMSANKVRESVQAEVDKLVAIQQQYDMKVDAISSILAVYNEKLRFKYTITDFERYIDQMSVSVLTDMVKKQVNDRMQEEQAELERIEQEKQEAIERAKAEAEAKAQREAEEAQRRHQEELDRAEAKRLRELEDQEVKAAVQMQEAFESVSEIIPEEAEEEEQLLTIKYSVTGTESQIKALERYMEQYLEHFESTF